MKKSAKKTGLMKMMDMKSVKSMAGINKLSMPNLSLPNLKNAEVAKQSAIILGAVAAGATAAYFLDPDSGKKRRDAILAKIPDFSTRIFDVSQVTGVVREVVAKGLAQVKSSFLGIEDQAIESDSVSPEASDADGKFSSPAEEPELNRRAGRSSKKNLSEYAPTTTYPQ